MYSKLFVIFAVVGLAAWNTNAPALAHNVSREARTCLRTEPVQFPGTIVDAALATPAFSTLVGALQAANLVSALQGPGPFTVFAPTNDAFDKIPAPLLQTFVADTPVLTGILTYHVVPEPIRLRRSTQIRDFVTLQGQSVFLSLDEGGPRVNQSNIACQAVKTSNGTIFVIDSVLLPQF